MIIGVGIIGVRVKTQELSTDLAESDYSDPKYL
jgi:hypothetical protein